MAEASTSTVITGIRPRVLFVSHPQRRCGVHEYGLNAAAVLKHSKKFDFVYAECSSAEEFEETVRRELPTAIIYNYVDVTLPGSASGSCENFPYRTSPSSMKAPSKPPMMPTPPCSTTTFAPPTSPHNPLVFKTGRIVPAYVNRFPFPKNSSRSGASDSESQERALIR